MNLKVASATLMLTGVGHFFAGIGVAFFHPRRHSQVSWWIMIGGWGVGMVGVGLHANRVFRLLKGLKKGSGVFVGAICLRHACRGSQYTL